MENNKNLQPVTVNISDLDINEHFENEIDEGSTSSSIESKAPTYLQVLLDTSEELRIRKSQKVNFEKPIITYGKYGIIFPNTITLIQGPAGAHKSRLAQGFCSLVLSKKE